MKRTTRGQLREGDRPWGGRLWEWVVDCDLKAFFDTVNNDVLMNRL